MSTKKKEWPTIARNNPARVLIQCRVCKEQVEGYAFDQDPDAVPTYVDPPDLSREADVEQVAQQCAAEMVKHLKEVHGY